MSMEHFCLIVCSICVSAVLGHVPPAEGRMLFTHFPSKLRVKEGETATFTCNITALEHNPKDFNWNREKNSKEEKIAELKTGQNDRMTINVSWDLRIATLHIQNVTLNDSGNYFCVHLNVTESFNLITSNRSQLIVERHSTVTGAKDPINQKGSSDNAASLKMTMISTSILLTLLLMLLIGLAIILVWHKQRNKPPQPQIRNLENPSQDPAVYTVDYGVLEFGSSKPCRKSADLCVLDQIEYATIIFPTMEDHSGRTA